MNYDFENPFSWMDKRVILNGSMSLMQFTRMNYDLLKFRRWFLRFIKRLEYDRVYVHDPVVPYLAITIFDNFTSGCKARTNQNLNASEEEIDEYTNTIEDILIQDRNCMPPVTALCFLDYLIGKLTKLDLLQMRCLKSFATHKLCALKSDLRLAKFQPSIMAAAALASSINTFYEKKLGSAINDFVNCKHLNKESLKRSVEMLIPDVTVCIPESPDNIRIPDISEELTITDLLELRDITQEQYVPPSDCIYDSDTDTAKPMPAPTDCIRLHKGPAPYIPPHKKPAQTSGSGGKK